MLSYQTDASILTIRAAGIPTPDERQLLFDAVHDDPDVARGALLMLDVRGLDISMKGLQVVERLHVLLQLLGPKLGWVCALVAAPEFVEESRMFQEAAKKVGLRVEIFSDDLAGQKWLRRYGVEGKGSAERL